CRIIFKRRGFNSLKSVFFENNSTLLGKYGEEGDRLIFKLLNSGDFLKKTNPNDYQNKDIQKLGLQITEKSLRYDLTVPFARFVVMHQNELDFPFKRYQIQPVWRADRPQKGRYREFFQCDADVIGSQSLLQEIDFIHLYDDVFTQLKVEGAKIQVNNRKILSGIAEIIGATDQLIDFTVALDKLDKIGRKGVEEEMLAKGITSEAIQQLSPIFEAKGGFDDQLMVLKNLLANSEVGQQGIEELQFISEAIQHMPLQTASLDLNITLARGLDYYTGCIFEVAPPKGVQLGSIGGGGRYDDLTGIFGLKDMSGVGISFGLDRIYLVLEQLNLFPESINPVPQVLFINFGASEAQYAMKAIRKLRNKNIASELYPDDAKMKKQMNYANKRGFPFVILAGESEMQAEQFTLKNMKTGEQQLVGFEELIKQLA
ncbi:MAG: histidine--tRNA ligase, partial [Flavobacteriaceae bacterium]|nr:histidine--tRNA ligase [Flavobacteriaceae bacterium]